MSGSGTWRSPQAYCSSTEVLARMHPLLLYNSITRSKNRFIPRDIVSSRVLWYQCGPTVYAESHIGHARTYVSLDVVRRIMTDMLHYDVIVCQNITDIDDKIILRSNERNVSFEALSRQFEGEFIDDMAALGVRPPDIMTRVSEYVTEIVEYVQVLVNKGFAYASNGSVYFDIAAFELAGHTAGRLMPEQRGNSELLAEGEGALTGHGTDKRGPADFVLWKKSKSLEGGGTEPSWESPWGPGRPGWHIECSVMSHCAIERLNVSAEGSGLDIHAGGVDLKFPHHENELIQSEAFIGSPVAQWVNYWLHTGHLHIRGLKMSKSLKNFVTIREALQLYTSRQIRFCFLLHKYNAPMDYSDATMAQAVAKEKIFAEFFHNVRASLRSSGLSGSQHVGTIELSLLRSLDECRRAVKSALMDDIDTPTAIALMLELVRDCNRYMEAGSGASATLSSAARYITSTLRTFGLAGSDDIGFGSSGVSEGGGKEETLGPYLDVLCKFREMVRVSAIAKDSVAVLQHADALRDDMLPELGVRMEDKGSGADVVTVWKLDDVETLRLERAMKVQLAADKRAQREEQMRKQAMKEQLARTPPEEMFKDKTDMYSAFDAAGVPTHDSKGEPLNKSVTKKLQKEWAKQRELFDKYSGAGTAHDD